MKYVQTFFAVAGWTIVLGASAVAGDVKVIANPSVKVESISARELKSLYLGEKSSINGAHVEPVISLPDPAGSMDYLDEESSDSSAQWQNADCKVPN